MKVVSVRRGTLRFLIQLPFSRFCIDTTKDGQVQAKKIVEYT